MSNSTNGLQTHSNSTYESFVETEDEKANLSENEQDIIGSYKWWEIKELRESQAIFFPEGFVEHLHPLCNYEIPKYGNIEIPGSNRYPIEDAIPL